MTYNEILMEHNLYPVNRGKLKKPNIETTLVNSSCGDEISVQLAVENGIIIDGKYDGVGCAISMASADLMLELVKGKKIAEAQVLTEKFKSMIIGKAGDYECLGVAQVLQEVSRMPARAKCASLAWKIFEGPL